MPMTAIVQITGEIFLFVNKQAREASRGNHCLRFTDLTWQLRKYLSISSA